MVKVVDVRVRVVEVDVAIEVTLLGVRVESVLVFVVIEVAVVDVRVDFGRIAAPTLAAAVELDEALRSGRGDGM